MIRSEDGESFLVKNPEQFEKTVIPEFFKHSKFSSFIRQLNFYGFRKVKFFDNVKLEVETANFWRFKHEHFVRGKPDLLKYIRRSNNHSGQEKAIISVPVTEKNEEDTEGLRSEVDVLKDRIAQMSSNLDQLTALVNKITIADDALVSTGSKRKLVKVEDISSLSDQKSSCSFASPRLVAIDDDMDDTRLVPDEVFSSIPASLCSSSMEAIGLNHLSRSSSFADDDNIVDDLIASFGDESVDIFQEPGTIYDTITPVQFPYKYLEDEVQGKKLPSLSTEHPNAPDPALIARLSEALTILPRDMQELLVNRLITTITSHDTLLNHLDAVYKNTPDSCATQERKSGPRLSIPMIPIRV